MPRQLRMSNDQRRWFNGEVVRLSKEPTRIARCPPAAGGTPTRPFGGSHGVRYQPSIPRWELSSRTRRPVPPSIPVGRNSPKDRHSKQPARQPADGRSSRFWIPRRSGNDSVTAPRCRVSSRHRRWLSDSARSDRNRLLHGDAMKTTVLCRGCGRVGASPNTGVLTYSRAPRRPGQAAVQTSKMSVPQRSKA
jgi:hypothetical protein